MSPAAGPAEAEKGPPGDVAIVGLACLFPGAPDLQTYWENIVSKVDAIGDPPEEWHAEFFYDPDSDENDRIYTQRGGYLGDLARFDPLRYGVMPTSVDGGEPDQFLALHVAQEALADAGWLNHPLDRERVGVIIGRGTYINRGFTTVLQHGMVLDQVLRILRQLHPEHTEEDLAGLKRELKASLPPFNGEVAPALVPNMMSGRIANRLDLMGPNYTVDAACASSLIALDLAMGDLVSGRCDLAVAGGVHASTPAPILQIFCQLGALSRKGRLRPFDADADGTLLGEGLGFCVLKRLADAERDGDRVYAVIKAIGTASDGRALGLLAPRVEGEELALRRAYEAAGVSPDGIGLIEAHGTGTQAGDQAEIEALRRVFGSRGDGPPRCAVGSVKSMISHLLPAAGIAGVIKAALALYHRVLPPTLHCDHPNPALKLEETPLYVNTETRPWIHGAATPRRAGVNAFGFGGINAHAILEEHRAGRDAPTSLQQRWEDEVLILQGDSREELIRSCDRLGAYLEGAPAVALKDLAATLNTELAEATSRLAIVASGHEDLLQKVAHAGNRLRDPAVRRIRERSGIYFFEEPQGRHGKLAFAFPGEGSQYPGMLSDLCLHFPEVRSWFDLLDRAFAGHPRNYLPSQVIFPPPNGHNARGEQPGEDQRLWQMDFAAEAIFAANQAMLALLRRLAIHPDAVVGHSAGEYSALDAAGARRAESEDDLIRDIRELNGVYEQALADGDIPEGSLLAVGGGSRDGLSSYIERSHGAVHLAMDNCPNQAVLCGNAGAMAAAAQHLRAEGFVCTSLAFRRAYHTPMFRPFSDRLRGFFGKLQIGAPTTELYSCATAAPYPRDPNEIRTLAAQQWARPVRFRETIEAMYRAGVRIFVEVGPRNALTSFTEDILRGRPAAAIAANLPHRSGVSQVNHLVAQLAAHGVPMRLEHLYARRGPRRLSLNGGNGRVAAGRPDAGMLRLSTGLQPLSLRHDRHLPKPAAATLTGNGARNDAAVRVQPEVMQEYFSTMEQFLATQNEVMLAVLQRRAGAPAGGQVGAPVVGPDLPLLRTIVSHLPGRELVARLTLNPLDHPFLRDHTLGGRVSLAGDDLLALPLVPLTIGMEALAEAAAALVPGKVVVGMREVRAHRWLAVEDTLTIELIARPGPDGSDVEVQLREMVEPPTAGAPSSPPAGPPALEATVVLGDGYPAEPEAGVAPLTTAQPSAWTPERLYRELMFHGPSFRGVAAVDAQGDEGIEATLGTLARDGLLRSVPDPQFLTDPVLLDAAGQLVGCWTAERLETGFHVFPFRVEAVHFFGPSLPPGRRAACRARITLVGDWQTRSDIEVLAPGGGLHARIEGWWDRRFDLPAGLIDLRSSPRTGRICAVWPEAPVPDPFVCCLLDDLPVDLLNAHGAIWQRALAHLVLGRRERETWRSLTWPDQRRSEWLLGRATAKDAVRRFLMQAYGMEVPPADVEITRDERGRPEVDGPWALGLERPPLVSLAHAGVVAVAVAGDDGHCRGVGVDLEPLRAVPDGFAAVAFGGEEQAFLASLDGSALDEWTIRLWCAKEAVAKALGWGLPGGPKALVAREWDPVTGSVAVGLSEAMAARFPHLGTATFAAPTARRGDLIVAACVTEGSL